MLDFDHERTIRFTYHLEKRWWFKKERWRLKSIKMDPEIKTFFKRYKFNFTKDKKLPPRIVLGKLLGFLGENKLDNGGVFEEFSDTRYVAEVHVKRRSQYSHSG